jgi:hypothetical protein
MAAVRRVAIQTTEQCGRPFRGNDLILPFWRFSNAPPFVERGDVHVGLAENK